MLLCALGATQPQSLIVDQSIECLRNRRWGSVRSNNSGLSVQDLFRKSTNRGNDCRNSGCARCGENAGLTCAAIRRDDNVDILEDRPNLFFWNPAIVDTDISKVSELAPILLDVSRAGNPQRHILALALHDAIRLKQQVQPLVRQQATKKQQLQGTAGLHLDR